MKAKLLALLTLVMVLLALLTFTAGTAQAADRDYKFHTVQIRPKATSNGTSAWHTVNKGGTNWIGVDPTNGVLYTRINGTNFVAINQTNLLYITNGGVAYPIKIRNGLI